jgi:hypothetical protein
MDRNIEMEVQFSLSDIENDQGTFCIPRMQFHLGSDAIPLRRSLNKAVLRDCLLALCACLPS